MPQPTMTALALRLELSSRALAYSAGRQFETGYGSIPTVIFKRSPAHHGNFHPQSYRAIYSDPAWLMRLNKAYTGSKWIPRRHDRTRAELDCATSSDALLMNIFCHPDVYKSTAFIALLGIDNRVRPDFGFRPRLPLMQNHKDRTEIDMSLGRLLVEAKLTESSFQTAPLERIRLYKAVEEVFEFDELPRCATGQTNRFDSYQLIRGVLAAWHMDRSFVVLCDARRADLIERWFQIIRAVRSSSLRASLSLLTWQEIAATVPNDLQVFLEVKYGIYARVSSPSSQYALG